MKLSLGPRTPAKLCDCCKSFSILCLLLCDICHATPSILLSKKNGPPTSRILVSGRGFAPNAGVDIFFDTKDERLVITNGKGEFDNARAYAPRRARPGKHWITALERNSDEGAQARFVVQTDWAQGLYDTANSAFNSYENVLDKHSIGRLRLKWSSPAGSTTPTVADGVLYSADTLGRIYALNAKTGLELWTYKDSCGSVFSPPAVVEGVVYFGGYCEVHALDAKSGKIIWIVRVTQYGGGPFALTVAYGKVYFGTGAGYAVALDAKSGGVLWSYYTGNYELLCALAVVDGVVYVASGQLIALDAASGEFLWDYPIGNGTLIYTPPSVYNGVVYVATINHDVYAVRAADGSLLWSYATGGVVFGNLAVANNLVYVASDDGTLYALDAYTGAVVWKNAYVNPDGPLIAGGIVYEPNYTLSSLFALDASTGDLLWEYSAPGIVYVSVADGMVYVSRFGETTWALGLTRGHEAKTEEMSGRPNMKMLHPDFSLKVHQERLD